VRRASVGSFLGDATQLAIRLVLRSAGARVALFPVQLVCVSLTTWITISTLGADTYAEIGVILGLQNILVFLNLGTTAALSTAAGERMSNRSPRTVLPTLVVAVRVTSFAGVASVLIALLLTMFNAWPDIVGFPRSSLSLLGPTVVVLFLSAYHVASLATTVLMNSGREVAGILATGSASVFTLVATAVVSAAGRGPLWYVIAAGLSQVCSGIVGVALVRRHGMLTYAKFIRSALRTPRFSVPGLRGSSAPALVIMVLLPISYSLDRLILSHLSTDHEVGLYSVAIQFYMPLLTLVGVSSAALWGHFAKQRSDACLPSIREYVRLCLIFGVGGCLLGSGLLILLPYFSELVSNGSLSTQPSLAAAFSVLIFLMAVHQPSAMLQTDEAGLRWHAPVVAAMTGTNVLLSLLFTPYMGSAGPVWASCIALLVLLVIPSFLRGRRVLKLNEVSLHSVTERQRDNASPNGKQ